MAFGQRRGRKKVSNFIKLCWSWIQLCAWSMTVIDFSSMHWVLMIFFPCLSFSFLLGASNLYLIHVSWFKRFSLYSSRKHLIELLFIVLFLEVHQLASLFVCFFFFYLYYVLMLYWYFGVFLFCNYMRKYWLLSSSAWHVQIEEVRSRLNLDVAVASDSPPAPAPAPIESFTDMVFNFINI